MHIGLLLLYEIHIINCYMNSCTVFSLLIIFYHFWIILNVSCSSINKFQYEMNIFYATNFGNSLSIRKTNKTMSLQRNN